jgi:hypothetical protein
MDGGTLTMTGASISGNTSYSGGGGVIMSGGGDGVLSGGTLTMNAGASISGNMAYHDGGGVLSDGMVTMNAGASISGNKADRGGGVYISASTFTMYGGAISGNTTFFSGGGGVNMIFSTFTMYGGTISGNTAKGYDGYGGGVYVWRCELFHKIAAPGSPGGIIYGNDAGDGVYEGYPLKNTSLGDDNASAAVRFVKPTNDIYSHPSTYGQYVEVYWDSDSSTPTVTNHSP